MKKIGLKMILFWGRLMSLVKSKSVEVNKSELEVLVDVETFQDACRKAYLKKVKRMNVPGFRKGKAPRRIIEERYGEDVFFDEAINLVYPNAVEDAVKEAGLDVVGFEEIEPVEASKQTGCRLRVVCILKPEVEIANYKGIEIKSKVLHANDEVVEKELNRLRERNGRLVSVEGRAAKNGDVVTIDYEGFVDGKKFDGGSAKNQSLKLGSGQFIKGFEEQVEGHSVGDKFDVNVMFPVDYGVDLLSGKPVRFSCVLHEIKVLELPNVDDEFAKDVSKFDTLKELKDDIKQNMEKQFQAQADDHIVSEIMGFLFKNVVVDIPEVMIENLTDDLAKNFEDDLGSRGVTLNDYLAATRTSGYDLKNLFTARAQYQLKTDLALEKIAKIEKIEVTQEDYDNERHNLAERYGVDVEKIRSLKIFSDDRLKAGLLNSKTIEFIKNNAKIIVVEEKSEIENALSSDSEKAENKKDKKGAVGSSKSKNSSAEAGKKSEGAAKKAKKSSSSKAESKVESAKGGRAAKKTSTKSAKSVSKTSSTTKTTKASKVNSAGAKKTKTDS